MNNSQRLLTAPTKTLKVPRLPAQVQERTLPRSRWQGFIAKFTATKLRRCRVVKVRGKLGSDSEEVGDEPCFRNNVTLCYPSEAGFLSTLMTRGMGLEDELKYFLKEALSRGGVALRRQQKIDRLPGRIHSPVSTLTENVASPFQAEPAHARVRLIRTW
jgi:hypothetical protein